MDDVCFNNNHIFATTSSFTSSSVCIYTISESKYSNTKTIDLPCASSNHSAYRHTICIINGNIIVACESSEKLYVIPDNDDDTITVVTTSLSGPRIYQSDDETVLIGSHTELYFADVRDIIASLAFARATPPPAMEGSREVGASGGQAVSTHTGGELQVKEVKLELRLSGWIRGAAFTGSALFVASSSRLTKYEIKA